jgi:hypothetical protein
MSSSSLTRGLGWPRVIVCAQAPEVIGGKLYDTSADVHSFAILYWELITGKMPYGELQNGWQVRSSCPTITTALSAGCTSEASS